MLAFQFLVGIKQLYPKICFSFNIKNRVILTLDDVGLCSFDPDDFDPFHVLRDIEKALLLEFGAENE